ncbi:hypothetical protein POX_b03174 [Penicillium oxalicum]|uniref:Uncharacterized protein n=1 Tax=Penicillium oxalicum (strain 114-2 / CGMCC 5302) TaxID=933388 RepID=S8B5G0_PENO1|nr:hypothetical protein POX_b03174 [Penicillium oxalicum]EPS29802.1 hypothetical protein PDE_04752 [Penicillium oxalicum 114-2]KAI2793125.1 hypothetical protein POX_b03174 [Penicillium oxalicum]
MASTNVSPDQTSKWTVTSLAPMNEMKLPLFLALG